MALPLQRNFYAINNWGMIVIKSVSGFEEKVEKLTLKEEKRRLLGVSDLIFDKVVENERENILLRLMSKFKSLKYEDLEEIYDDGCLVLWEKMLDSEFKLKEKSMVGYLYKICWNIGMHYLRKVNEDGESLDRIMERGYEMRGDCGREIEEMFDVMDKRGNEDEKYEKLERVWNKLKDVDRMILESYYVDGCRMDEIAKRIGYKNGNSVKSKKTKVLRRMMEMMQEGADFKNLPVAA